MNLKKTAKYLLLTWWLYLWAEALLQQFSDNKKIHQGDIFKVLHDKEERKECPSSPENNNTMWENSSWIESSAAYAYSKWSGNYPYGRTMYKHQDSTTTKILNALSWFDTDILYPDTIKSITGEQDSVMYKTIWAIQVKYKNPKTKLVEKFDQESIIATYNPRHNTTSLRKNILLDKILDQKYYIESWIDELTHAYQLKRDGIEQHEEQLLRDDSLMTAEKRDADDVYSTPWTVEYEAHHTIEKILKKEFIATYASSGDMNDINHLYRILSLNNWFFPGYNDLEEIQKRYEKIVARDWEIRDNWIQKYDTRLALWIEFEKKRNENKNNKYRKTSKGFYLAYAKSVSASKKKHKWYHEEYINLYRLCRTKWDIKWTIKYYQLSFSNITRETVRKDVALAFLQEGQYKEALQIYKYEASNWNTTAMLCLVDLYDPECIDSATDDKECPYKDNSKKEYRKNKYIEAKIAKN